MPPGDASVCGLDSDNIGISAFSGSPPTVRALNPAHRTGYHSRVLYAPWAATAWRRAGVDPRRSTTARQLIRSSRSALPWANFFRSVR